MAGRDSSFIDKDKTRKSIETTEYELSILSGGLRGIGLAMSTLGAEDGFSMPVRHLEEMGYLVEAIGNYAQRLSFDLEAASDKSDRNILEAA